MTSFDSFISNFHFIRPFWLLAIFVLIPIIWQLKKLRFYQSPWQQLLPKHLSQVLVESSTSQKNKSVTGQALLLKPLIIGLLSIIALAGPAWEKLPQPVYQTERGSVLIMDMSYSMFATDIKPNRLTRARFKAIDLLNKINEGDTGLIAYAGDAFVISPLTQDVKNIALLLPSLTPEIMPVPGANPLAALTLAHEMLINAGHLNGDIYWFTDDVDNQEITDIHQWTTNYGHQLNILGVGTENGAPITLPSGELLKDNNGAIVVPRLPSQKLKSLASRGNGNYQTIKNDDSDINNLIINDALNKKNTSEKQQSQQTGDQWQEQGAWLLLIVLPLMLSYFRRGGVLLMLPLTCLPLLTVSSLTLISPTSMAATSSNEPVNQTANEPKSAWKKQWQNLWQTSDQQAQTHYNQQNYQDAAKQFNNTQWQGSAHYKAGNYEAALEAFKKGELGNSANALYNQGNALAQLQQYDQAIESYEKALSKDPDLQDAKENLEKIKQLQKQQQQQQQQGDKSQNSNDQKENDQKDNEEQQQDSQSDQSKSDQSQQNQDNQNQQSSDKENTEQQQQNSPSNAEQNDENQQNNSQSNSEEQKAEEAEEQQAQQDKQAVEQQDKKAEQGEEKTAAQIAAEQQAKEAEQKYQQLLNKVTDDPYLLLRNKMQLEYQKRKQNGTSQGVNKQW